MTPEAISEAVTILENVRMEPGGGDKASPKVLVVLVKMKAETFAFCDASRRFSVPVILASIKSCLEWVAICGLCNVAA